MMMEHYCSKCNNTGRIIVEEKAPVFVYGEDAPYVEVAYPCPSCNGGEIFQIERVKSCADIPRCFYNSDMTSFRWDIYKEEGKCIDLSKKKLVIEDFCNNFKLWESKHLGLFIHSETKGSGKTFLASCICNSLIKKEHIGTRFVSANNLIELDKKNDGSIDLLCKCKLLVIDDLGQKNTGKEWLEDILFRIVDSRYINNLVTIYTSNYQIGRLEFDDRTADRINKSTMAISLPNCRIRSLKAQEDKLSFLNERGLI